MLRDWFNQAIVTKAKQAARAGRMETAPGRRFSPAIRMPSFAEDLPCAV